MTSEMKPCPKCHKHKRVWDVRDGGIVFWCFHCHGHNAPKDSPWGATRAEAEAAWNKRHDGKAKAEGGAE